PYSIRTQKTSQFPTADSSINVLRYNLGPPLTGVTGSQFPNMYSFLIHHYSFISLRRLLNKTDITTGAPTKAVTEFTGNAPSKPGIRAIKLHTNANDAPASKEAGIRIR